MARLASQARGGYYAAAPEAVASVLERLRPPTAGECLILDPCAGTAMALLQLAQGLDGDPWAVELSEDRAVIVKALLDEQALCPADFLRTLIGPRSHSLVWLNPPYDASVGDGRVELQFLRKATPLLIDGGVMALVCPQSVADSYELAEFFEAEFDQVSALPFPEAVRHYEETVVLGRKRKASVVAPWSSRYEWLGRALERNVTYTLPAGQRPKVWRKTEPTDAELVKLAVQSPLRFMLDRPVGVIDGTLPKPPLSLGIGHRALLLSSGYIDGLIQPPGEPAHVIRGTCGKESYVAG